MYREVGKWREVPGPKTQEWLEKAQRFLFRTTVESNIVVARYEGPYVYDPDGNEYYDFSSGVGVNSFGGGESLAHVWDAIRDLKRTCGACGDIGTDWYNTSMIGAAEYVVPRIPLYGAENRIYFTEGGALANEAALKLAWAHWSKIGLPNRKAVVCFEGAFHGRTGFVINLLDRRKPERYEFYPRTDYQVIRAPYPAASLENPSQTLKDFMGRTLREERPSVAAVILEIVQGEGGIIIPEGEALRWWVEAWRNEGALIIFDDVQMGLGRTGKLMSYENFGVKPDIVTLSKHFGSGMPVAAMLGPGWANWERNGRQSESFQGSPITAVAVEATLRHVLEHGVIEQNARLGKVLERLLKDALSNSGVVREIRGLGLAWGIEFHKVEIRDLAIWFGERLGLRLAPAGFLWNPTIRLLPSFASKENDLVKGVAILAEAIERARAY